MEDERAPLLQFPTGSGSVSGDLGDHHTQFCRLVGARPVNHPDEEDHRPHPRSLYARAMKRRRAQSCHYVLTTALVNTLLLSQIVIGAALTGLGASNSSRVLITVFGALNTIIAGVIAFLKSRGQPMRARMFRDDLSRVVDEIENSAVMWYGISASAHGYDAIDTDDQVTVRSEVARLTRLYDKAVKMNTMNDPDMYNGGAGADSYSAGLRKNPGVGAQPLPGQHPAAPALFPDNQGLISQPPAPLPVVGDPDASPARKAITPPKPDAENSQSSPAETTTPPTDPKEDSKDSKDNKDKTTTDTPDAEKPAPETSAEDKGKDVATASTNATTEPAQTLNAAMEHDPDASPASAARLPKKEDTAQSSQTLVDNDKS